ncbi:hypothetical protein G4V62_08210 [Bacillaceae bacterium SIJ1]|uniref:TIGR03826 family flagellar region protein n=1 Tax=Litoribacterium kuwaitense TaxID=1398745 RepID=UPI0013ED99CD|nr:TIGR03826 family flagellar region protein [Litoribacterium kuwaitense]NGP44943.1 hypothetical protein [Litoribacterium kuwaitense]
MEVDNCPSCGALFYRTATQDVCRSCFLKEEELFDRVHVFLKQRKNRTANMQEVVEKTGVEEPVILKFLKKGRLRVVNFPNLGYPCERCGQAIQQGTICDSCSQEISRDLATFDKEQERTARVKAESRHTYHIWSGKSDKPDER